MGGAMGVTKMTVPDPYIILGIDRSANEREIKIRYQQLVRKVRNKITLLRINFLVVSPR